MLGERFFREWQAALAKANAEADFVSQTSIAHLTKEKFSQVPIAVPSRDEQRAIATVISDLDAELTALEARRDKTHALNQGMTRELLTGRTRLV
jgi:type I restriction enzyme S subunit